MKTISAICLAMLTVATVAQPQCSVQQTDGYQNCKTGFHVNGKGSDALWCASEPDCVKVFPGYVPNVASEPWRRSDEDSGSLTADGVQEAVSAAPSVAAASALVAASAVAAMLC
eukprot:jgi/Psemu1/302437/fgenesh1_kg.69_\